MHKLCLPLLALALGLPAIAHAGEDKTPSLPEAGAVKTSLTASASASASVTVSDKDALNDDILAVIDLPIAAADAREAGVEESELGEALSTTREGGLSAGDASEVLAEEADATRKRGAKKGFGRWVRMQVAAGLRGKKLADKIRERKQDTPELDATKEADLRAKIEKQRDLNKQWRTSANQKRGELVAKGKARVLLHKERHEQLAAKIDAARAKVDGAQDDVAARLRTIDEKIAAASEADKAELQAERDRLAKTLGKLDKKEDKLDKKEDRLDKKEDRLDKREEKLDAKADAKADAKGEGKGHNKKSDKPGPAAPQ